MLGKVEHNYKYLRGAAAKQINSMPKPFADGADREG